MSTNATDYHAMWADLGLNLAKHDSLLGVGGQHEKHSRRAPNLRPPGIAAWGQDALCTLPSGRE